MSCYACSDAVVQYDTTLGVYHAERCNHYSGPAEICPPDYVGEHRGQSQGSVVRVGVSGLRSGRCSSQWSV